MRALRIRRRAGRTRIERVGASGVASTGGGSSSIRYATSRPRDPMFYWRDSGLPFEVADEEELSRLRAWCRFMYRTDPILGSAIDVFAKFPTLGMSLSCKDPKLVEFYETLLLDQLNYEEYLTKIGREYWCVGEAFPLGSWSEMLGVWEADELLDPDDVVVERSPFLKEPRFSLRLPEHLREILRNKQPVWEYEQLVRSYPELEHFLHEEDKMPVSGVLLKQIKYDGDTFNPRGVPLLLRAMRPAIQEEALNAAQDAVADRLYTPLILAKLGASAQDLGTQRPWVPTEEDIDNFIDNLDAALAADFRVLVHHFAVDMQPVFGRETMPNFDPDFDRLLERKLMVFGLSKTALSGADGGETYAADAMNRDLVTQLLSTVQRYLKRFIRDRMLVVAEAQGHYDYEVRGGERYVVEEEVLVVDDETGEQTIERRPKLLVPDITMAPMNMRDEESRRMFLEALRATGVPISMRTRMVGVPVDLEDEIETCREEAVRTAVEEQETRKQTYTQLRRAGLPVPPDLAVDFDPRPVGLVDEAGQVLPGVMTPQLGMAPAGTPNLAPTAEDLAAPPGTPTAMPLGTAGEVDPSMVGGGAAGGSVIPLSRNMARPPESDEMRAGMPRAGSLHAEEAEEVDGEQPRGRLLDGPRHVGKRWAPPMEGLRMDEEVG
jgi:hypothetical protein